MSSTCPRPWRLGRRVVARRTVLQDRNTKRRRKKSSLSLSPWSHSCTLAPPLDPQRGVHAAPHCTLLAPSRPTRTHEHIHRRPQHCERELMHHKCCTLHQMLPTSTCCISPHTGTCSTLEQAGPAPLVAVHAGPPKRGALRPPGRRLRRTQGRHRPHPPCAGLSLAKKEVRSPAPFASYGTVASYCTGTISYCLLHCLNAL